MSFEPSICQRLLKPKITKNLFQNLKYECFAISKKYCQSLELGNILLRFSNVRSQNISLVMVGLHFIVIQFLSHQPALKLVR